MKQKVSEELSDTDGKIQLLFATEAYGMGADAPDVRRIIHIGPPNSLESKICFILKLFTYDDFIKDFLRKAFF